MIATRCFRGASGDTAQSLHIGPAVQVRPRDRLESADVNATRVDRPFPTGLLIAIGLGAVVAIALGVYGNVHDPSQELVFTLFFQSTIAMKVWFATFAIAFAFVQVTSALWLYGKLGLQVPSWLGAVHRISGRLAFLFTLPVAYHCLWSLGFQETDTRVLAHSLLGCLFYGAFAAKVTIVRSKNLPGLALPIAGGTLFAILVGVWLTSARWFITEQGFPDI